MPTITSAIFRERIIPYRTLARCPCAVPDVPRRSGDEVGVPMAMMILRRAMRIAPRDPAMHPQRLRVAFDDLPQVWLCDLGEWKPVVQAHPSAVSISAMAALDTGWAAEPGDRTGLYRSARRAEPGRPADPDQGLIGVGQRELVHPPRLVLGAVRLDRLAAKHGRQPVDVLGVEVEPERVAAGDEPTLDRVGQVEVAVVASDSMR